MTTNNTHTDIIAAFIDGEPVLPEQLREALAQPSGRDLLVDLLALRDIVAAEPASIAPSSAPTRRPGTAWRALAAAAVLALVASGGYLAGLRAPSRPDATAVQAPHAADAPPKPTVVVSVDRWQDVEKGGGS